MSSVDDAYTATDMPTSGAPSAAPNAFGHSYPNADSSDRRLNLRSATLYASKKSFTCRQNQSSFDCQRTSAPRKSARKVFARPSRNRNSAARALCFLYDIEPSSSDTSCLLRCFSRSFAFFFSLLISKPMRAGIHDDLIRFIHANTVRTENFHQLITSQISKII